MIKLDFIESGNLKDFNKIVVFIHGWKGNKNSFLSLSSIIKIPNAKWIFPQAPYKMENSVNDYSELYKLLYDEVDVYGKGKISELDKTS